MAEASTILLVDDEESVQKLLTAFRSSATASGSSTPGTAREALARFAAENVDLVVLDLMLPRLDGLEVCKRLRAQSTVPIIMLTARDDEPTRCSASRLGADDYITKPFSIREFRSRVRACCAARPRRARATGTTTR